MLRVSHFISSESENGYNKLIFARFFHLAVLKILNRSRRGYKKGIYFKKQNGELF